MHVLRCRRRGVKEPEPTWYDTIATVVIEGTAVAADLTQQTEALFPVTHYYDEERVCLDCKGRFLFYAEEQKYWYEDLQFDLSADCVRCYPCRKILHDQEAAKRRYDALVAKPCNTPDEELELALARLQLVEAKVFSERQLEKVRAFLNAHPKHEQASVIRSRVKDLEAGRNCEGI